jgi:hypothetical protein
VAKPTAAAASDLAGIESTISTANATAAASTTQIVTAAEDEADGQPILLPADCWNQRKARQVT